MERGGLRGVAPIDRGVTDKPARRRRITRPGAVLETRAQASERTGIPPATLYDLIARGDLPVVQLPDSRPNASHRPRLWIRRADLDALIEQNVERRGRS